MPIDLTKALAKLDKPPSGHNWTRFVQDTKPKTTRSILSFVKGAPRFTYQAASSAIRDRFLFGISLDAAVSITRRSGAPAGREQNRELVEAFYEHDRSRQYPIGTCVEFERQWFRISRDLIVPVSPLVVFREQGRFVPVFLCGWTELTLTHMQRRLLMSIYEDAFLSLTDYQNSPAEFLFFPKVGQGIERKRQPEVWHRGDYALLSTDEMNDQVGMYLEARQEAREILIAERREEARQQDGADLRPERDLFNDDPRDE